VDPLTKFLPLNLTLSLDSLKYLKKQSKNILLITTFGMLWVKIKHKLLNKFSSRIQYNMLY